MGHAWDGAYTNKANRGSMFGRRGDIPASVLTGIIREENPGSILIDAEMCKILQIILTFLNKK